MRKSRVVDQRGSHESASGIRASHSSTHLHLPPHDALPSFVCNVAASRARSILVHGVPEPARRRRARPFVRSSGKSGARENLPRHQRLREVALRDGFPRHGRGGGGRPRPRRRARSRRDSVVRRQGERRARRRRGSPRQPPRLGRRQARKCGAARSRPLRVRPGRRPCVRPGVRRERHARPRRGAPRPTTRTKNPRERRKARAARPRPSRASRDARLARRAVKPHEIAARRAS